ncbi:ArnT family glycosyltransferase [Brucella cytisi]|uniref:ArnT family glycosyltransferase n=1 Tax=Brucella cytisi TaxID=407152 RepID=UPI0035DDFB25
MYSTVVDRSVTNRTIHPYVVLAVFCWLSFFFRPLLPVDETRYLSVAWEMFLQKSFFVPTLNFEPYFQKPPLLFWLIEFSWIILGVSRAAAICVIFVISSLVLYFTRRLALCLFPDDSRVGDLSPWVMLGSIPFIIYSTLVLFDLLLTLCVLIFTLMTMHFARSGQWRDAVIAGVCVGLGVLAKGPVVLIHAAPVILFHPLWKTTTSPISTHRIFLGTAISVAVGFMLVLAWLLPAFYETGFDFAYNLIWRQSAGRIAGSIEGAHARPFYFYLLLLPILLLPWILTRDFWRAIKADFRATSISGSERRNLLFLTIWTVFIILAFSMISGKQPHYIVPVVPAIVILFSFFLRRTSENWLQTITYGTMLLFFVGQLIASFTIFKRFDLTPISLFITEHGSRDWAYMGNYQGEFTFLSRLQKPVSRIGLDEYPSWFSRHPDGYIVTKTRNDPPKGTRIIFQQPADHGYFEILESSR